jgi:hypothetical protein
MSQADINFLASYIDDPFYWADVPTAPGPAQDGGAAPPAADAGINGG